MKIRPFPVTAAAGVVAALVVPSLAHAWRSTTSPGTEARVALAAAQQATPDGTRRLAPSGDASAPLPRGGRPAPVGAPEADAPHSPPKQERAAPVPDLAALLGEPDLTLRERNYETLVERAAHEPAVRSALEALASGAADELAWTARLALREVRATSGVAPRAPSNVRPLDPFAQLERIFGADPFNDPFFTHPFGGFGRSPFLPPQPGGRDGDDDPFERMRTGIRRLEELVAPPGNDWLPPGAAPAPQGGVQFKGRSESLSVTPDGVRLEVEEDGPDGRTSRTYEARTLEELYTAHPELRPDRR